MVKHVGFVVAGIAVLVVAAIAFYFWQLVAPVQVSNTLPVAPTLAAPTAVAQVQPTAPDAAGAPRGGRASAQGTPGARPQRGGFPGGTPGAGFPPGGFPGGTPPPGGFPRGGFPPGGGPPGMDAVPVSTAPPAAPTLAAAGAAQVYRINAKQSKAAYNADETFLQDFAGHAVGQTKTVGTTQAIAGDILVDTTNPAASKIGEIVVDISQFKSDTDMRDNAIRRQWLESAKYPLATFQNATLSGLPASWPQDQPVKFQIAGDLTVHNTTQHVTWDATATLEGTTLHVQATTNVQMSQFGVQAPSMPMLTVKDPVTLTLDLVATPPSA